MATIKVSTGGFTPEIWSDKININLDNYGAYNDIVNRKYQGEIKKAGDKVKFYTYGNLTPKDYLATSATPIEWQDPDGNLLELTVDQQKYIAFQIDEIEKVQSNVELVNGFTKRMAIAFAQTKDKYIHSLAKAGATTKLTTAAALTKDDIWKVLCDMYAVLARKNAIVDGVDYSGKRPALVITPEVEGILKQAPQYFANAFGNETLRKGQIGHVGGFDVFVDTNVAADDPIIALTSDAITFAEQITETDIIKAENSFHHKVKSLHVYGGLVANPDCIVTQAIKAA